MCSTADSIVAGVSCPERIVCAYRFGEQMPTVVLFPVALYGNIDRTLNATAIVYLIITDYAVAIGMCV